VQRTVCSLERRDVLLQGHHDDRRQHPIRRSGRSARRATNGPSRALGPVSEEEQQQDDDGDDERDDRDGPGIHENVPLSLWAPLSASRFAQYRDDAGRTR
jgi:hypothetical protein